MYCLSEIWAEGGCDVTKPCLLKSCDCGSLIHALNHWFKTNDSEKVLKLHEAVAHLRFHSEVEYWEFSQCDMT